MTRKGAVKLVKPGTRCTDGRTAVVWNQSGEQGAQGIPGPPGPPGPQGETGAAGSAGELDLTEPWHEVGTAGEPEFGLMADGTLCNYADACHWANYEQGYETAGFMRDRAGMVHLKGLVCPKLSDACKFDEAPMLCGANSTPKCATRFFTLPPGFRPPARILFPVLMGSNSGYGRIDVHTDGRVELIEHQGATGGSIIAWVNLDGISFRCVAGSNGCPQ